MGRAQRVLKFERVVGSLIPQGMEEWLDDKGFFTKPASTHYHGAYEGGLFDHSLAVMELLLDMTHGMDIKWQNERSPYIVGMFHDLCKIEAYRFCEDEYGLNGEWKYNEEQIIPGHGDKSILLLSQFLTLTEEEIYCIRFHMGPYEKWSREQYGPAIAKYETVLWTHTADMYASKVKGI